VRILAALAVLLALAPPDPTTVTLLVGARSVQVAAAENGGLLSIPDVASAVGATAQPGASLAVELSGHRIVVADGVATAAFDDRVVMLARPTRAFSGALYAPWEFFEKTLLPAAGMEGEYDRAARRIRLKAGPSSAPTMDVALIHLNGMTQVVLRESGPVAYDTAAGPNAFTVRFKSPVVPAFEEKKFDDPLVSRIALEPRSCTVSLREGGLSVNQYDLKSPDRIVVEFSQAAPQRPAPGPVPATAPAEAPAAARAVVIDPGHGGDETGAVGPGGLLEKDVTLDIARRLAAVLGRDPGIRPVLTRTGDTLVALDERAAIANHEKAAVFVSIHANSSRATGARGSETYYLSLAASDKLADAVAREENASPDTAGGLTGEGAPSPDLDFILWDMAQTAHLNESAALAESIQDELNALLHTENRGIKQAPFRVLVGATMPAVLVETAFISNDDEAKELARPDFRQSIAEAIARAVESYLRAHPPGPTSP
jgi:N-acetylmuramoyl-L-alanine amidase